MCPANIRPDTDSSLKNCFLFVAIHLFSFKGKDMGANFQLSSAVGRDKRPLRIVKNTACRTENSVPFFEGH